MVFQTKILVAGGHLGDIDKGATSLVVFKDSGAHQAFSHNSELKLGADLLEEGTHGNEFAHGHAESNILTGGAAESDVGLQLGLPDDGATKQSQSKTSARLDRNGVLVIFVSIEAGEVSVDITVQTLTEIRSEENALVTCVDEVPNDTLQGLTMRLPGGMGEASDLVDSKLDVGPRVGRKIQQHSHCCSKIPLFMKSESVLIRPKWFLDGRSLLRRRIGHSGVSNDFVCESLLSQFYRCSILLEIDTEETKTYLPWALV